MSQPLQFQSFQNALEQHRELLGGVSSVTLWRYSNGQFPKALRLLFQHPALLRALAEDAERQQAAPATVSAEPTV